jgi:hypothetical protein
MAVGSVLLLKKHSQLRRVSKDTSTRPSHLPSKTQLPLLNRSPFISNLLRYLDAKLEAANTLGNFFVLKLNSTKFEGTIFRHDNVDNDS